MKLKFNNKGNVQTYENLPITWGDSDLFTHTICIGPTRCGKSALAIQQLIRQTLLMKKMGTPIGLSIIEPKGDLAKFTREMAVEMGFELGKEVVHVDPMLEDKSHKFNVMQGDVDIVAEATVTVLKGMFGKQEQFFAIVQELSARHVTKLLKTLFGDNLDIVDLVKTLQDEKRMLDRVADLRNKNSSDPLIEFFDNELLGENKDRYRQFVMGLRAQLENLISNKKLKYVLSGKSDINLDEHYEKGGILAVNTGLAELGSAGDAFGQFVMMHLQRAAFRRKGTELTRVPHILIVDEASRYVNSEVEVFLAIGAEYRVAGFFALQSSGQLEVESGKLSGLAMKRAFLASCRNRIVFGGLAAEDAAALSEELGKDKKLMRQNTYKNNVLLPNLFPDSYRDTEVEEPFYTPSNLRYDIPKFHFIYQLQQDGQPTKPKIAKGVFVPRNWKEIREWEYNKPTLKQKIAIKKSEVLTRIEAVKEVLAINNKTKSISKDENVQQIDESNMETGQQMQQQIPDEVFYHELTELFGETIETRNRNEVSTQATPEYAKLDETRSSSDEGAVENEINFVSEEVSVIANITEIQNEEVNEPITQSDNGKLVESTKNDSSEVVIEETKSIKEDKPKKSATTTTHKKVEDNSNDSIEKLKEASFF